MDGGAWWAAVHGVAKSQTRLSDFPFTFHFHELEKEMATHSSVLAWRIPGTGSLVGCRLWGRTESDMTEATQQQQQQYVSVSILCNFSSIFLILQFSWTKGKMAVLPSKVFWQQDTYVKFLIHDRRMQISSRQCPQTVSFSLVGIVRLPSSNFLCRLILTATAKNVLSFTCMLCLALRKFCVSLSSFLSLHPNGWN